MLELSPTTVADYGRCAYKCRLRKIRPKPPSHSLATGIAVHEALRIYWRTRAAGANVSREAFVALVRQQAESVQRGGLWVPPDSSLEEAQQAIAEAVGPIANHLYEWAASQAVPTLVEEPLAVDVGEDLVFRGRLDMVLDGAILDLKTGKRPWTQAQADAEEKLTAYAWLGRATGLIAPKNGVYEAAIVSVTPKGLTVLWTRRTDGDIARYRARVAVVAEGIAKDYWPPASDGWWHSPEYCEYWSECPYGGGEVAL